MKYIIILLALTLFAFTSCSNDNCEMCDYITEDNLTEAMFACNGLANNYPDGYVESGRVAFEELCEEDKSDLELGVISSSQVCSGINATVRARLECK